MLYSAIKMNMVAQRRSGEGQFAHTSYLSDFFSILETEYGARKRPVSADTINTLEARLMKPQVNQTTRLVSARLMIL